MKEQQERIYLDYHATTPVLPEVFEAMSPYFVEHFGNSSSTHQWGWKAEMAISKALKQVADLVNTKPSTVYFTSGATESLHWAISGWVRKNPGCRVLTTATEHQATYGACEFARELSAEVVVLPVDQYGRVRIEELERELKTAKPTLFSFIYGNNEIGTLNPMNEICGLKKKYDHLVLHADAAQCVGKVPVDLEKLDLDYLSFSGHKLYGPKGIGALVIKELGTLKSLFCGGGQQRGQRAGTCDTPSIVGLGAACRWANDNMTHESERLMKMRDQMADAILATGEAELNGHPTERLPHNLSLTFKNLTLDKLLLKLPKVGFSSSSACSSGTASVSHVLKAIGRTDQQARQTVRFGMGHSNTADEIDRVKIKICEVLAEAKDFHS